MSGTRPPPGFEAHDFGGEYIRNNGPLYLFHQGQTVKLGFRVEPRHCNPMGNCQVYCPAFVVLPAKGCDQTNGNGRLSRLPLCNWAEVNTGADDGDSHNNRR